MRLLPAALCAGLLSVAAGDVQAPRAGQIVADPRNPSWMMRKGGGHAFVSGPGDPEGFLYRGRRRADGTREGDQEDLIRKLIAHGGNCIYMQAIRSHGGDGAPDHNPFISSAPSRGLSEPILDQWETWFRLMDDSGILIYLFVYDDGSSIWKTGDMVGDAEMSFLQTLVKRFRHHDNLIWIVAEEAEEALSMRRCQAIASVIAASDRPGRIVANHHHSGTTFKSWVKDGSITQFAMQCNVALDQVHARALEAIGKAAGRYGVVYSENTKMEGATPEAARSFLWASAMAGVTPMLFGADIANTPAVVLRSFRIQQSFFEATDFHTMSPHDELAAGTARWVLANPGRSYIAYADAGSGPIGIRGVPSGAYDCTWLDCTTGRTATERSVRTSGSERMFTRPAGIGRQCAVWVRRTARQR